MKEDKKKKIEDLYAKFKSAPQADKPKRGLFGSKCPKCNNKVTRENLSSIVVSGEAGTEFGKRVVSDATLPDGVYQLTIEHYTCKCGYEFIKPDVGEVDEGG